MQQIAIIGAGGFAREVADIVDAANALHPTFDLLGYVVDARYGAPGTLVNERPILGDLAWFDGRHRDVLAVCGVGAPQDRRQIVERALARGIRFASLVHPSVIRSRWVTIAEGVVIAAGCILTNNIRIGPHVHLNLDCTVGHDVSFEEYATLAPGVHVSGNVRLEQGCYVGTGANLIEKKTLGAWSVVGAGSTIVTDVPANSTVVGVPGKVVKTREAGWHLS
jgi:sugar O-acyltransferase (sialic acid O-acetyltransferase NeuD family)